AQDNKASSPPALTTMGHVSKSVLTIPAGTQVPLRLKQAISTKNAKPGDAVYAETVFPVVLNDRIMIPAGTYVQGRISEVKRPGRVKGRAEILMHFTSLIFPNGYTALLPGSVQNVPGSGNEHVKGQEGTIEQNGDKTKDAGTIATTAGTGAAIGGLAGQSIKDAAIGGGVGAAAGLIATLVTRGPDVMLPEGTSVQMVLQRPLTLDEAKLSRKLVGY
ncbi:MAG TPA: TrbI/VirB10 family protein, partial [Terriglobales bacterium]|nr:TrbI/VirB10 family protein [Terriglobales bacterium]